MPISYLVWLSSSKKMYYSTLFNAQFIIFSHQKPNPLYGFSIIHLLALFTKNQNDCGISSFLFSGSLKQLAIDPLVISGLRMKLISSFDYLGASWRQDVFNYIFYLYTYYHSIWKNMSHRAKRSRYTVDSA